MTFQSKGNTMNTPPPSDTQGTPKDEKKETSKFLCVRYSCDYFIYSYILMMRSLQTDRNERITHTQNWFDIFLVFLRSLLYGHRFLHYYFLSCLL